jgi:hypothetical protein
LSPDYFLFPKVKLQPKGARFDTIEEIQKAVTDQQNKILAEGFSNAMKKLETRANLCIMYFFPVALRPNAGRGLLILEVFRSHTTTHHSR